MLLHTTHIERVYATLKYAKTYVPIVTVLDYSNNIWLIFPVALSTLCGIVICNWTTDSSWML